MDTGDAAIPAGGEALTDAEVQTPQCSNGNAGACARIGMDILQVGYVINAIATSSKGASESSNAGFNGSRYDNALSDFNSRISDLLRGVDVEPVTPSGDIARDTAENNDLLRKAYEEKGYVFNGSKISTPNGPASPSDLASGESMAAAGLIPASQIDSMNQTIAEASSKSAQAAKTLARTTDPKVFSGYSYSGGSSASKGSTKSYNFHPSKFGFGRKPAAVKRKGFVKKLANGGTVGVAVDNLFDMVHRKYKEKAAASAFIER